MPCRASSSALDQQLVGALAGPQRNHRRMLHHQHGIAEPAPPGAAPATAAARPAPPDTRPPRNRGLPSQALSLLPTVPSGLFYQVHPYLHIRHDLHIRHARWPSVGVHCLGRKGLAFAGVVRYDVSTTSEGIIFVGCVVTMKLSYDPRYNVAYIRFHEKQAEVESLRISDELVVDIAPMERSTGSSF